MTGRFEPRATPLDHLVYGVPDLDRGVRDFESITGVRPVPGGRHSGYGTANYLVGLGSGRYLEIIGIDPDAPPMQGRRLFGIRSDQPTGLVTWAVRTHDIDGAVDSAREAGYDPGAPTDFARETATGETLRWRLTPDTIEASGGLTPFLIDWGHSPHPTRGGLTQLELTSFRLAGPQPERTRSELAALSVTDPVTLATRPTMRAVLTTPLGPVTLD
jgi:Glyoxalase-like domain